MFSIGATFHISSASTTTCLPGISPLRQRFAHRLSLLCNYQLPPEGGTSNICFS